jgi:predicted kinase
VGPYVIVVTGLPGTGKSTVAGWTADHLGAPVLAHDWAMSALRPYPSLQDALDRMDPPGHGRVGWSILGALAQSQLRRGGSVILDGVARAPEIEHCRKVARAEHAQLAVVLTECADTAVHRSRIEGRRRSIPNWYELEWAQVERSRAGWVPPRPVEVSLETGDPMEQSKQRLIEFLDTSIR